MCKRPLLQAGYRAHRRGLSWLGACARRVSRLCERPTLGAGAVGCCRSRLAACPNPNFFTKQGSPRTKLTSLILLIKTFQIQVPASISLPIQRWTAWPCEHRQVPPVFGAALPRAACGGGCSPPAIGVPSSPQPPDGPDWCTPAVCWGFRLGLSQPSCILNFQ